MSGSMCTAFLMLVLGQGSPAGDASAKGAQSSDVRCGAFCLYVSLKALGIKVPAFDKFEQELGPPASDGYSMGALAAEAEKYGAKTLGVKTTLENLRKRSDSRFACIAHVSGSHFINVVDVTEEYVHVIDPPSPAGVMAPDAFRSIWDGNCLLIANGPLVAEEDLPKDFPWKRIAGWTLAVFGGIVLIMLAGSIRRRFKSAAALSAFFLVAAAAGCRGEYGRIAPIGARIDVREPRRQLGQIAAADSRELSRTISESIPCSV